MHDAPPVNFGNNAKTVSCSSVYGRDMMMIMMALIFRFDFYGNVSLESLESRYQQISTYLPYDVLRVFISEISNTPT